MIHEIKRTFFFSPNQTADDTLKDESKDKSNDSSNDPGLNLRILRNYIIDYLSKGQYSIAETLCKSALEFEKTNNGNGILKKKNSEKFMIIINFCSNI